MYSPLNTHVHLLCQKSLYIVYTFNYFSHNRIHSTSSSKPDFFEDTTTLLFDIIATDNGNPRRGTSTPVNITLSNTCVFDVEFNEIVHNLSINETGALTLNIPKYWSYQYGKLFNKTT